MTAGIAAPMARSAVESLRDDGLQLLRDLVAIPSVSTPEPDRDALTASARATAAALRRAGVDDARVVGAPDAPAVIGERRGDEGAPTVLLYGHHDVQSAEAADWRSDPFEARVSDGRLYARGAADDKGGVVAHWMALAALGRLGDALPVNVRLMIEGEEELGSPTLPDLLAEHGDDLRADAVLVADMVNPAPGRPSLTTSLRGIVDVDVTVRTGARSVHSGMFGGLLPDAILVLSRLVATLHRSDGSLAVEGFSQPSDRTPGNGAASALLREAEATDGLCLLGRGSVRDRIAASAINVLGVAAPSLSDATHQIVPAATARLSLRLEAGKDPQVALAALRHHLERNIPWGAEVTIDPVRAVPGCRALRDGPVALAADRALREAFGVEHVPRVPQGGGVPACAALAEAFPSCELLLMGVADCSSAIHEPDESVCIDDIASLALAELLLMCDLGAAVRQEGA